MIDRILKAYEESAYDFRPTAKPGDPLEHLFHAWVPYYRMKAAISKVLQPASILEIGVRYGYGAAAFLSASPHAHYTGIDLDADSFGGEKGAIEWARNILPSGQYELLIADSQKMSRYPGGIFDLIHVDGQQDEHGTFHDLVLASRQGRYILVDGYFWTESNFRAANDFIWKFRDDIQFHLVIPGYAGELLIKIRESSLLGSSPGKSTEIDSGALKKLYSSEYFLTNCGGWEFYDETRDRLLHDGRLRSMADLLFSEPVNRVLDLGAGRGEITLLAALAGCEVTAVDYSDDAINILRRSLEHFPNIHSRVNCVCADAASYQPSGQYDAVLAGDLIEHLNPKELERLYSHVAKCLTPRGRFIVHTFPNKWYYQYAYRAKVRTAQQLGAHLPANPRSRYELLMHINEQSPRTLHRSLREHFRHVLLWFGSPENPKGSLTRKCRPRELAEYRDLFAVASPLEMDDRKIASLFESPALAHIDAPLEIISIADSSSPSAIFTGLVRITNPENGSILASRPPFPVYLSYRWFTADDQRVKIEGMRNNLTPALVPGSRHVFSMRIQAPPTLGKYKLRISLVQEHRFWLCDRNPEICPTHLFEVV